MNHKFWMLFSGVNFGWCTAWAVSAALLDKPWVVVIMVACGVVNGLIMRDYYKNLT